MSKRSSILSRVFFRRASIKELVPDLKLVLAVLVVGCESHVGVYRPAGLGEETGLDPVALSGALADIERRSHILTDAKTGEIFIKDFFRDNSFATPQRRGQARDDFGQIESAALREAVLRAINNNPSCCLQSADLYEFVENQNVTSQGKVKVRKDKVEAAVPRAGARGTAAKSYNRRESGIITWLPADCAAAEKLELEYPPADISAAITALKKDVKQPVPGRVAQKIEQLKQGREAAAHHAREGAALRTREKLEIDPLAQAKGERLLSPAILARVRA